MKVDNKGFTLIELLSVMVILITISLVVVLNVTESLTRRDNKEKEEEVELAIGAAKIYFSLNNKKCVKVNDLIGEYITDGKKIDSLNKNYVIVLNDGSNTYDYKEGSCS